MISMEEAIETGVTWVEEETDQADYWSAEDIAEIERQRELEALYMEMERLTSPGWGWCFLADHRCEESMREVMRLEQEHFESNAEKIEAVQARIELLRSLSCDI